MDFNTCEEHHRSYSLQLNPRAHFKTTCSQFNLFKLPVKTCIRSCDISKANNYWRKAFSVMVPQLFQVKLASHMPTQDQPAYSGLQLHIVGNRYFITRLARLLPKNDSITPMCWCHFWVMSSCWGLHFWFYQKGPENMWHYFQFTESVSEPLATSDK